MALVTNAQSHPRVSAHVGDIHLLRVARLALVPDTSSTLIGVQQVGRTYELGFAALVAGGRAVYLEVALPVQPGGVPFALMGDDHRIVLGNVTETADLVRSSQPVNFAGRSLALYVR